VSKITLLVEQVPPLFVIPLLQPWIQRVIEPHVDITYYDPAKTYDKQSTVFFVKYGSKATSLQHWFINEGYKIVHDNLWEVMQVDNSKYILQNPNWFRYNESLWYKHIGYDTYQPIRQYKHLALMPMRRIKPHRNLAESKLQPWLDDFVWSYVFKKRHLPNDAIEQHDAQRYFDPAWYDQTYFSFVSESEVVPGPTSNVFITEKTYKPIAFRHPFVIMGQPGSLKFLKSQGFETFENLFDENYDTEPSWMKRLDLLVNIVKQFNKQPYDTLTEQKLKHNHELFFDTPLVTRHIVEEIIYPLLNYAET
jgi:hypothetical protein